MSVKKRLLISLSSILIAVFTVGLGLFVLLRFIILGMPLQDDAIRQQAKQERAYLCNKYDKNFISVYDNDAETLRYRESSEGFYVDVWQTADSYQDNYEEQASLHKNKKMLEDAILNDCRVTAKFDSGVCLYNIKYTGDLKLGFLDSLNLEGTCLCNFYEVSNLYSDDGTKTYEVSVYEGCYSVTELR